MPHLIIEYAQDMAVEEKIPAMMNAVHEAAVATALFDESHIKVRAIPVRHYLVAKKHDPFIHAQLHIRSGRDQTQKKLLSETVLNALRNQHWPVSIITVEVVDMDTSSYTKYSV